MNQKKQDRISKDVKRLVLGKTKYKRGQWGFLGYEVKKSKKKVREPLVKIKASKGKHGATDFHIDYPDSWNNLFKGKKPTRKRTFKTKTTVRDVTNQRLLK